MSPTHSALRTYAWTGAILLALLGATIVVGEAGLGPIKPVAALLIAGAKAALVAFFFMHLKPASGVTRLFAGAGLLWLAILIGLTVADALTRGWARSPAEPL